MKNFLFTTISLIIIVIFALLRLVWVGFSYFSLAGLMILSIYWAIQFIRSYIYQYRTTLEEKYKYYVAQIVNTSNVTTEEVLSNRNLYFKKFKKTLFKDKTIEIAKISFSLMLALICLITMFIGKL